MATKKNIYRILDANLNRYQEGLRVCEEVARFILNDKKLTIYLRRLRHQVSEVVEELPGGYTDLLNARDSKADVGKSFSPRRRGKKVDHQKIFLLNLQRVKEALRVLEEFSLFLSKKSARGFQKLRFKIYNLEKVIFARF